jgi:hypothetical protein
MYDLVAIEFLNRLGIRFNRNMPFIIGAHNVPEEITRHDWTAFAKAIGVPPAHLMVRMREMAESLPDVARSTRRSFASRFGDNQAYDKLVESVADRCRWVLQNLFAGH